MKTAVIIDAVRTPVGRAHAERGWYRDVRSDDLMAACIAALIERNSLDPAIIEDVHLGCTQQTKEQGMNIARIAGLMAGLPIACGGSTVNRLCGSSMQALHQATHAIMAGAEEVHIVGGLEHMHHLPMDHGLDINPKLFQRTSKPAMMMGVTAEFLAQTQGISREEQDRFAFESHQRASRAWQEGKFDREIIGVYGRSESGERFRVDRDQCVREDTSMEALGALDPVFLPKIGTVTAGNSSPLNDGAAALLVMSEEKAKALGLRPLAKIRSTAVAGVEPCVMGTGPIPASQKALERAGLTVDDLDLAEFNEAFAVQAMTCIRALKVDEAKVNVHGGAVAIGHPLGASGARITTTLVHAMQDRDAQFGLATMCIGLGQGIATVLERVE
ncbi:MAG: acetyl-CoA C-acyltransferase FadA [Pirellulales bacterium]